MLSAILKAAKLVQTPIGSLACFLPSNITIL